MRKGLVCFLAALSLVASLAACNTMAGAGQDVQQGGKALQNSAERNGASQ